MGRTVPSFRIIIAEEKAEWKPFRDALDKSEKKLFDEMWDIPKLYVSACSNSVQLVPLQPVMISILFHHYKELKECIRQFEALGGAKIYNNDKHEQEEGVEQVKEFMEIKPTISTATTFTIEDFMKDKKTS